MLALSIPESRAFTRLEAVIAASPLKVVAKVLAKLERDREACKPAIQALEEIRDRELFRASAADFETYCRETWGLRSCWVNRLVVWVNVNEVSKPMGFEVSERQARRLNGQANRMAAMNGTDELAELEAAVEERKAEINNEAAELRRARAGLERPEKPWRDVAEARLKSAIKAWAGRSEYIERCLARAWERAASERQVPVPGAKAA
jgi:hypothetical protein